MFYPGYGSSIFKRNLGSCKRSLNTVSVSDTGICTDAPNGHWIRNPWKLVKPAKTLTISHQVKVFFDRLYSPLIDADPPKGLCKAGATTP